MFILVFCFKRNYLWYFRLLYKSKIITVITVKRVFASSLPAESVKHFLPVGSTNAIFIRSLLCFYSSVSAQYVRNVYEIHILNRSSAVLVSNIPFSWKNIFANGIWQIKLNDLPLKLKQTIVIEVILHRSVKLLFVFNIFHIRTQTVYLREHFKICVAAIIGRGIAWQVLSFFPAKQFNLGLFSKDVWIMPVIFLSASHL